MISNLKSETPSRYLDAWTDLPQLTWVANSRLELMPTLAILDIETSLMCRYSEQLPASGSLYIEPFGFGMNFKATFKSRALEGFLDS